MASLGPFPSLALSYEKHSHHEQLTYALRSVVRCKNLESAKSGEAKRPCTPPQSSA